MPLAGGQELLLTHQELSGLGEDHRTLRRMEPPVLQRQVPKDKELVEEPKSFIHTPEEGTGNDSSFGDRGPDGVYQLQKFPKTSPKDLRRSREVPRAIKARENAKPSGTDLPHRGTGSPNSSLQPWTVCSTWPELSWNAKPRSRKGLKGLFREIDHGQRGINVEIGKLDSKLTKIALDINELKKHDKKYTEWYDLTNVKFDSIINSCSRIENTCQIQNDEMEDLSLFKMNDQLKTLQDHVLKIVENTNQFATHLAKSDSERQKLNNYIISNVEEIHKNYEPHMPRHSTPLTEEKHSVKESFTPL
ncbi:hypothetical protein O181_115203 [Austropuccinia psidii MF-1]|uniref:Uncharacterized protein n=1 Tax=Austropuccinia psidii MF-1 TaxID=1389203 RepID=A0A9Q3K651_9BASI|nr:hypothetical protein [Austropuccinia psidii MF-1]